MSLGKPKVKVYKLKYLSSNCRYLESKDNPGMFHIRWPNGEVSEWMGNKTNAKENIYAFEEGRLAFGVADPQ